MDAIKNDHSGHDVLFEQKKVAVFQNKVYPTLAEAKSATFSSVKLVRSKHTGFCYNLNFDESLMAYDANYNNDQSNSKFFTNHLQNVIGLLKKQGLKGKKVIEIGCGKGDFLDMLKGEAAECIGFDPAYTGHAKHIVKDLFTDKYAIEGDVVILRHTLEHIDNPHSFLKEISKANNHKGAIYIEVPTIDWIITKNAFWDIFYEHVNYFSEASLGAMFSKAETGRLFGDQYIYCYANLADLREEIPQQHFKPYDTTGFNKNFLKWKGMVEQAKNAIVWGAGAKGSTFLNLTDPDGRYVKCVVDMNPVKQNKYVGLTGHKIIPPSELKTMKVETVFIMNENYQAEIAGLLKELGLPNTIIHTL